MRAVVKVGLYAFAAIALLACGLLAWAGFELELNMGSGSVLQATVWSVGIAIFGFLSSLAYGFLGKSLSSGGGKIRSWHLFVSFGMCALFAAFLALIGRNIFGTVIVLIPIVVLAVLLPVLALVKWWKTNDPITTR